MKEIRAKWSENAIEEDWSSSGFEHGILRHEISRFAGDEIIRGSHRKTGTMVYILGIGIERGESGNVMATPGFRTRTKYSVAPSRTVCASVQHRWSRPLLDFPRQSR